jgi:hypothetical protein
MHEILWDLVALGFRELYGEAMKEEDEFTISKDWNVYLIISKPQALQPQHIRMH